REEVDGAVLDRAYRRWDIAMPGYEDDRRVVAFGDLSLQVKAIHVRQLDVEDKTGGRGRLVGGHVFAARSERHRADAVRGKQFAQGLANPLVIIHDEDDMLVLVHDDCCGSTGSVKTNLAPCASASSAHRRPPCDSMIERQIASPIPIPSRFVVKNGSKTFSGCSIPTP